MSYYYVFTSMAAVTPYQKWLFDIGYQEFRGRKLQSVPVASVCPSRSSLTHLLAVSCDANRYGTRPRLPAPLVGLVNGRHQQEIGGWRRGRLGFIFSSPLLGCCGLAVSIYQRQGVAPARWPSPHSPLPLSPDNSSLLSPFRQSVVPPEIHLASWFLYLYFIYSYFH